MEKSFITKVSIFFLKIESTDFGVRFMTDADIIRKLPQASECLINAPDFWPDTLTTGYGT